MALLCSCSGNKKATEMTRVIPSKTIESVSVDTWKTPNTAALPKAQIYKMSGDYRLNVPITLGANGEITSFPAPSDIDPDRLPIIVADGYLLDRRGVSDNSVFTRYTYEEYSKLPQVPTLQQLKASIIPGARVTKVVVLPMNLDKALGNVKAVNEWIKQHK